MTWTRVMVKVVGNSCIWLHFGYIWKVIPKRYAVELDAGEKSKRVEDNFKVFSMNNWRAGIDLFLERDLTVK